MAGDYHLEGRATLEALDDVHALFERITEPVASIDLMLFETAVVEVIGNVVAHGQLPGEVDYVLDLEVADGELVGVVRESGKTWPVDLDTLMPPESAESGRGLPLIRAVLDDFSFAREGDSSVWRLRRCRTA